MPERPQRYSTDFALHNEHYAKTVVLSSSNAVTTFHVCVLVFVFRSVFFGGFRGKKRGSQEYCCSHFKCSNEAQREFLCTTVDILSDVTILNLSLGL